MIYMNKPLYNVSLYDDFHGLKAAQLRPYPDKCRQ